MDRGEVVALHQHHTNLFQTFADLIAKLPTPDFREQPIDPAPFGLLTFLQLLTPAFLSCQLALICHGGSGMKSLVSVEGVDPYQMQQLAKTFMDREE